MSKSEIHAPQPTQLSPVLDFCIGSFEFVSDFGFRASDFREDDK
jgi:hypothetical protein